MASSEHPTSHRRTISHLLAALAAVAMAKGCGDGDAPMAPSPPEPARPTTVTVSPATAELTALGATVELAAEVRDQNRQVMTGFAVTWASARTSVATVDASGLVTATDNGTATITATAGSASGSATVTVAQAPDSVAVSPAAATLTALGDTLRLAAQAFDVNGQAAEGVEFSWESSADSVATVDASGLVTGLAEGVASITATAGEASGSAAVTVMQPVATVEVTPSTDTIGLGSMLELTAAGFDENGDAVEGVEFSWESSDVAIATVDASGLVRGVAVGTATITASAGSGKGTAEITVMDLERAALVALYEATDGPNWHNSENWLTDAPLGEWYGVRTDGGGRVVRLEMAYRDSDAQQWMGNNLSGPIPPEFGELSSLEFARFNDNNLSGPIPPELGNLTRLEWLHLGRNNLSGPIPPEFGSLPDLEFLHLGFNDLSGPIPPALGDLAHFDHLDLGGNDLTGPIPTELGELVSLTWLSLWGNELSGPIPPALGNLVDLDLLDLNSNDLTGPIPEGFLAFNELERFHFQRNAGLCAPGTIDFVTWLEGIEDTSGPYCNESDADVLNGLYETAGGPDWTNPGGWLESPALDEWYGVTADSLGRVTALDLSRNGLVGRLPANLGELARMAELRIGGNPDLSGLLPLSLDRLALRTLHYAGTGLCAPVYASFRDWLGAIPSHEGTDAECAPLSDREILEVFYESAGGPDWTHNENWLTDAPLGDWHGVEVDEQGRVVALVFDANRLTGRIPRELGGLANLQSLVLFRGEPRDGLRGPIPAELGDLVNLRTLNLAENDLTGPIPDELGSLTDLRWLSLHENDLAGPIPPEFANLTGLRGLNLATNRLTDRIPPQLGDLTNLWTLSLGRNELTGPIPSELANLTALRGLNLAANRLTGLVPAELGGLADLESLYLGENELTGPLPPELGELVSLRNFALQGNSGMSGVLPVSLTNLRVLETFQTVGTALCAPSDAGFVEWLQGVPNRRVAPCEGEPATAYVVQAVQSREFPVPLVAGEEALLRVFVTAGRDNDERLPPVRASFYLNGMLAHVAEIPGKPGPIPTEVDEGSLAISANAVLPAEVVEPGLEMVVEVDPDGTLDPALGVAGRIPPTGRTAIDVQALPVFNLMVVPFLWAADPDSTILELARGMAADPEGHELLEDTRKLLPVGALDVKAHVPVLSSSNDVHDLYAQTRAIRIMEGGTGYWMGSISGDVMRAGGLAGLGGEVSFSVPNAAVIAHEFGHNLSLPHAPCGGASDPDPAYPYPDGSIGAWGYDAGGGTLVRPRTLELMGWHCRPDWISDYFFTKALHFRLSKERPSPVAFLAAQEAASLLLWGGADADGESYLNPAFVVDAPPALPDSNGEHRITGQTASGDEIFALDFAMPRIADGDGSSSFAFVLPVQSGWAGRLASITLSGPGGSARLDGDTDLPMTILIDPRTGQVRGILRDLPRADAAAALAPQAGFDSLDVLFSRGIPDTTAWGR